MSFTFIYKCPHFGSTLTYESNACTLTDILEDIRLFLLGSGYCVDGELCIESRDDSREAEHCCDGRGCCGCKEEE